MLRTAGSSRTSLWTDLRFVLPVGLAALLLFLVVPSPLGPAAELSAGTTAVIESTGQGPQASAGKLHKEVLEGQDALWELPPGKPRGLLFVAHGCQHQATDFWPASDACKECLGLPEEVRIREAALALGYAVLGVSSVDRQGSRCWDAALDPQQSVDGKHVAAILEAVKRRERLASLPVYALGASSGGAFVLMLPHVTPIQGVIAQIMAVPPAMLGKLPSGRPYPPTVFVHMPRDGRTAAGLARDMEALRGAGVAVAEIRIQPRPVTPEFLERSRQISAGMAAGVVQALRKAGLLAREGGGAKEGLLLQDPRAADWRSAVTGVPGIGGLRLSADESPLSELLNLAWAGHEIVSDHTRAALAWLAAGGKGSSMEQLLRAEQQAAQDKGKSKKGAAATQGG